MSFVAAPTDEITVGESMLRPPDVHVTAVGSSIVRSSSGATPDVSKTVGPLPSENS